MVAGMHIEIGDRRIGPGHPVYVVAELSANHNQRFEDAVALVEVAHATGADAIKLQTYTPDTLTIDARTEPFQIQDTAWAGQTLYELYSKAFTPWEWQPDLKRIAEDLGLQCFSTPFDRTAVDFLEAMGVPAYKIASFEVTDIPLVEYIARRGKPVIMSTGLSTLAEIDDAVRAVREGGTAGLALLKCTSAYPAPPEEMHLRTIPHMATLFGVPVGLSDHTLGAAVSIAAVSLGACIVEKHLTLSRAGGGPDAAFSLEPEEFRAMVGGIRLAERALGEVRYQPTAHEMQSRIFRRSLFVVEDVRQGEVFTERNVRSIRPSGGLPPRFLPVVLGRRAARNLVRGTPLSWDLVMDGDPDR